MNTFEILRPENIYQRKILLFFNFFFIVYEIGRDCQERESLQIAGSIVAT